MMDDADAEMKGARPLEPDGADDVGRLIRLAGRRPTVPPERAARVKGAARQEWLDALRRRRQRRIVWVSAALAAAASIVLTVSPAWRADRSISSPSGAGVVVESMMGPAWAAEGPREPAGPEGIPLRENQRLSLGFTVVTGDGGRVAIRLSTTESVRLDEGSRLRVVDADTLVLEGGAAYIDSGDGRRRTGELAIETPLGSVREIGTQYEVRLGEGTVRIRVREGKVALDDGARVHEVPAAAELTLDTMGASRMRDVPIHGPEWEWVARITTVPDFGGRSVRSFLEYVARERGYRLRFADAQLERAAGRIRLGGSIDRLSLHDALDAVLPTCGLRFVIEEGTLIVSQVDGRS